MATFTQFLAHEWMLFSAFMALIAMLMMHETRRGGASVTPAQLTRMVNSDDAVVLDVRDSKEFSAGHIVGAINIPHAKIATQMTQLDKHKEKPMVVVCKFGQHAGGVTKTLKTAGYEQVSKLGGGMAEWQSSQMPVVKA